MEASFWGLRSGNPSSSSSPTCQDEDGGTSIPTPTTPTATSLKSTSQLPKARLGARRELKEELRSGSRVLTPAGPTPPITVATPAGCSPDSPSHSRASISRVEAEPSFRTYTHLTRSVLVPMHRRSWPRQAWELGPSGQAGLGEGPATLSSTKAVGRPKKLGPEGHPNLVSSSIREPSDCAQAKPQASCLLRDLNADPRPRRYSKVGEEAASAPPPPVPAQDLLASDTEWRREPHRGYASAMSLDLRLTGIREETPSPRRPLGSAVSHECVLRGGGGVGGARVDRFRLKGGARRPESLT